MSGFAGLSRSRNQKLEGSTSSGYARNLRKECAGLVAGQAVLTAEVKDGGIREFLSRLRPIFRFRGYRTSADSRPATVNPLVLFVQES
jgi:hypothetical protein